MTDGTDGCPTNRLQITVPAKKSHRTRLPPRQFQTQLQGWPRPTTKPPESFWLADGRCSSRGDRKAPGSINVTTGLTTSIARDPLAPESLPLLGSRSPGPAPERVAGGRIRREPSFLMFWVSGRMPPPRLQLFPSSQTPRDPEEGTECLPSVLSGGSPDRLAPIPTSTTNAAPGSLAQKPPTVTSLVGNAATSRPPPYRDTVERLLPAHSPRAHHLFEL